MSSVIKKSTKPPTGLKITRNGNKYVATWKIGDSNYYDGQDIVLKFHKRYTYTNAGKQYTATEVDRYTPVISATGTKYTADITKYYNPDTILASGKYISSIEVCVRGNRHDDRQVAHVATYQPGSNKPTWETKETTIAYGWSKYEIKSYDITAPKKPSITKTEVSENRWKFTASASTSATDNKPYGRLYYQTLYVKNAGTTDGTKVKWDSSATGWHAGNTTATSVVAYNGNETFTETTKTSYTRFVRVRTGGIGGRSQWVYDHHVYGFPLKPSIVKLVPKQATGNITIDATFNTPSSADHPIDTNGVIMQYAAATPAAGLTPPAGVGSDMQDAPARSNTSANDRFFYDLGTTLEADQCMWVRVQVKHDTNTQESAIGMSHYGYLSDPTAVSGQAMFTPNYTTHMLEYHVHNASPVPDSRLAIVCKYGKTQKVVALSSAGDGDKSDTVAIPASAVNGSTSFGVYAVVCKSTLSGAAPTPLDGKPLMRSKNTVWQSGTVPKAPANVKVVKTGTVGTVKVSWEWSWADADGAQISWSDSKYAWTSNEEPQNYTVSRLNPSYWYISGLEVGKPWYFRVRLIRTNDDTTTYGAWSSYNSVGAWADVEDVGAWSDVEEVNLAEPPEKPSLALSDTVITSGGMTKAYWGYVSGDGTPQDYAEICEAWYLSAVSNPSGNPKAQGWYAKRSDGYYGRTSDTTVTSGKTYYMQDDGGNLCYNVPFASTRTAQHIDIYAKDNRHNWQAGTSHMLCVRVKSASGETSEEWSDPVTLTIASPMTATIVSTNLVAVDLDYETDGELTGTEYRLQALPLWVNVTGAGAGRTTVAVERAEDYHMDRPDETDYTGLAGETVLLRSIDGEGVITFERSDLNGHYLDDGARYRVVATTRDAYGQVSDPAEIEFVVKWAHQAIVPEGRVAIVGNTCDVTPMLPDSLPTGWTFDADDRCDIYRLSADRPELVYPGAIFGKTYNDPYPAIGGGYRFVYKTVDGDYIVDADGENGERKAWLDVNSWFDRDRMLIDFDGETVELYYNIDEDDNWEKSFEATTYLGGHVVGDWNPGIKHSAGISTVVIPILEEGTVEALRRLADYADVAHVRTLSGSSYAANIDVNRTKSHEHYGTRYSYSLTITRVDTQDWDGVAIDDDRPSPEVGAGAVGYMVL